MVAQSIPHIILLKISMWIASLLIYSIVVVQKQVKEADYGSDMQTVRAEYERHQKEHKVIDQFQVRTNT